MGGVGSGLDCKQVVDKLFLLCNLPSIKQSNQVEIR
jgi:hypothetical protein